MMGHLNKCPYMTCVPSSQVHFNVKVDFGSQKMQFRHPDRCPLVTGLTVLLIMSICIVYTCVTNLGGNMARFTQFPIMITRSTIIYEIISPGAAGSSIYV